MLINRQDALEINIIAVIHDNATKPQKTDPQVIFKYNLKLYFMVFIEV